MSRPSRPAPELMLLLEETMLLAIQRLIARHPDLLAAPEEVDTIAASPALRAAQGVLDAVRELTYALERYCAAMHDMSAPSHRAEADVQR